MNNRISYYGTIFCTVILYSGAMLTCMEINHLALQNTVYCYPMGDPILQDLESIEFSGGAISNISKNTGYDVARIA